MWLKWIFEEATQKGISSAPATCSSGERWSQILKVHCHLANTPDSKVHGANMGPIWGRQDPGGPHVGPMNLVFWAVQHHYNVADFSLKYSK